MPELPEVETTRLGIEPFILKQKIVDTIVRHPKLRFEIPRDLKTQLDQQTILAAERRGKYLLISVKKGCLIIHLGMSGSLQIATEAKAPKKHDHVDIVFKNGSYLRFTDPRRFGAVLFTQDDPALHPLLRHLGPEPLTKEFNAQAFYERTVNRKVSIKTFIMDNKTVVGVGNIYATEALFAASIHPNKIASSLTQEQCKALVSAIKRVLKSAIKQGGTTLKDFVDGHGNKGYFKTRLQVYGRVGQPCVNCQQPLQVLRIGQRGSVFCNFCQKK